MKKINFKKLSKRVVYLFFLVTLVLILLEVCFRLQLIDFYKYELKSLNPEINLQNENILVIGDSFSAHPESYIKQLRESFTQYNFINASIPGTGIKQHELFIKDRVKQFHAVHIIYQFYVGNDFTDIKHPVNYRELSLIRNLFWKLSENFLVLQFINRKLGFLNRVNQSVETLKADKFLINSYNKRVKVYFKGDSEHLDNTVFLRSKQADIYDQWRKKMMNIRESIPDSISVSLVLIPHCAQVNPVYTERMKSIGADLSDDILTEDYPLYMRMRQDLNGITVINPLQHFRKLSQDNIDLYYANDPHLNPVGQFHLGTFLVKNLKSTLNE